MPVGGCGMRRDGGRGVGGGDEGAKLDRMEVELGGCYGGDFFEGQERRMGVDCGVGDARLGGRDVRGDFSCNEGLESLMSFKEGGDLTAVKTEQGGSMFSFNDLTGVDRLTAFMTSQRNDEKAFSRDRDDRTPSCNLDMESWEERLTAFMTSQRDDEGGSTLSMQVSTTSSAALHDLTHAIEEMRREMLGDGLECVNPHDQDETREGGGEEWCRGTEDVGVGCESAAVRESSLGARGIGRECGSGTGCFDTVVHPVCERMVLKMEAV
ncbi:hypothetical protein HDU67_001067 [Dinochytrium kinnereticum]|nr:hypothetical protein HDU67_001067 [Dinochytrium kinnereticum]